MLKACSGRPSVTFANCDKTAQLTCINLKQSKNY